MKKFQLTEQSLVGAHLIEASAGTGKTYSITFLVLRLILEKGYRIDEILVVTFTEAATSELKGKIYDRLHDALVFATSDTEENDQSELSAAEQAVYQQIFTKTKDGTVQKRLSDALLDFDRAKVFTIHGFCQRLLFENAFETKVDFDLELSTDSAAFLSTLAKDFWLAYCYNQSPLMVRFLHENGLNEDKLTGLANLVSSKPSLVFSSSIEQHSEAQLETLYQAAFQQARRDFNSCRDRLVSVFDEANGINKRSYSKRFVPMWARLTTTFFSPSIPTRILPGDDRVFKFATRNVFDKAKVDAQIDKLAFFDSMEQLLVMTEKMSGEIEKVQTIFVEFVKEALPKRKREKGALFFDDLLQNVRSALYGDGAENLKKSVAKRFRAALIDEFQDTDSVQYEIFKGLFQDNGLPFFIIGDPKQAIYSFRGGDIFTYMSAAENVHENTSFLDVNWRASEDLVCAANGLFGSIENPFLFEKISFQPVLNNPLGHNKYTVNGEATAGFQFLFANRDDNNCDGIKKDGTQARLKVSTGFHFELLCDDIVEMLAGAHQIDDQFVRPCDVAVLVRTNSQGKDVKNALQARGVPAESTGAESVYDTVAARELHQILSAVCEQRVDFVKTAISTEAFGIKGAQLVDLVNNDKLLQTWMEKFEALGNVYVEKGLVCLLNEILSLDSHPNDGGLKVRVLSGRGNNRYVVDFLHVCELLQLQFGSQRLPLLQLIEQYEGLLQAESFEDNASRRSLGQRDAVQIVTIHKSKGLQYPIVYIPFPYKESTGRKDAYRVYHEPLEDNQEKCDFRRDVPSRIDELCVLESQAEQMRLLYVAITRAKHVCKIMWGAFPDFENSSLARLLHNRPVDQVSGFSDDDIYFDLQSFCERTKGAARIQTVSTGMRKYYKSNVAASVSLQGRRFEIVPVLLSRTMSFSSMVSNANAIHFEANQNDTDILFSAPELNLVGGGDVDVPEFEKGATFGNFVHEIFERLMLNRIDTSTLGSIVDEMLHRFNYAAKPWASDICNWITQILHTELDAPVDAPVVAPMDKLMDRPGADKRLGSLIALQGETVPEMEFVMPVDVRSIFNAGTLKDAMGVGAKGVYAQYAAELTNIQFSQFHGFLKGFIDLVFAHDGKWYIADYKTNFLGKNISDYGFDALAEDMASHHYYLQYHIYTVALHRYLRTTIANYGYEAHFGGVYYLYVRGMKPECHNRFGIYFDKPPQERIAVIDNLLLGIERGDN